MIEEEEKEKVEALEMAELVDREPTKTKKIGMNLNDWMKKELVKFLKENLDIFAWCHEDMPGIVAEVIQYCLNVNLEKKANGKWMMCVWTSHTWTVPALKTASHCQGLTNW